MKIRTGGKHLRYAYAEAMPFYMEKKRGGKVRENRKGAEHCSEK